MRLGISLVDCHFIGTDRRSQSPLDLDQCLLALGIKREDEQQKDEDDDDDDDDDDDEEDEEGLFHWGMLQSMAPRFFETR